MLIRFTHSLGTAKIGRDTETWEAVNRDVAEGGPSAAELTQGIRGEIHRYLSRCPCAVWVVPRAGRSS